MLDYCKTVLKGVHENKYLFRKELIKSLAWINPQNREQLQNWVRQNYFSEHADIIEEVLNKKYTIAS